MTIFSSFASIARLSIPKVFLTLGEILISFDKEAINLSLRSLYALTI